MTAPTSNITEIPDDVSGQMRAGRYTLGLKKPSTSSKFMAPWQERCVEAYISANLHAKIGSRDLARVAQCSPSRFHRSFKMTFGCTPHQYVIRRRIARAQRLMVISRESLIGISSKCGFVDQFHLRNLFRRVVGQAPGAWRRIHAQPDRVESSILETPASSSYSDPDNSVAPNLSELPPSFM
jgi:AraC-like DNA-binding protein